LVPPLDTQRAVHAIAQARAQEIMRLEQARAEAEEKKAAEAKAQRDALKNARRNARRGVAS
jgi:2-methylcitrate dehydratase PrpD